MENKRGFTYGDFQNARDVDLVEVASALGYTPFPVGRYYSLKEMDSLRIFNRKSWFRFSHANDKGSNGGSTIDFLKVFAGMKVTEAVDWLLNFSGRGRENTPETFGHNVHKYEEAAGPQSAGLHGNAAEAAAAPREFKLPPPEHKYRRLYGYLINARRLKAETVDFFVKNKLIYEEKEHHNIVFLGKNAAGEVKFASMRGTYDREGKGFRCDVSGSDKHYGFNFFPGQKLGSSAEVTGADREIVVFEAAIDMMSYCSLTEDYSRSMLALGMLHDAPLETFLAEHPEIETIRFMLDNDKPGREATQKLMEKYSGLGYETVDWHVPSQYKDCNDFLRGKVMEENAPDIQNEPDRDNAARTVQRRAL